MAEDKDKKGEVIEIPLGRLFKINNIRKNPWILSTFVLIIALVLVLIFGVGGSGVGVSGKDAGDNLVGFINSQGQANAEVVSVEKDGGLYNVIMDINGQRVPVYVTLDGEFAFLVDDAIPLSSTGGSGSGNSGDSQGPVSVEIGDSPAKGDKDAEVYIVEFSDYQCPFCGKFYSETLGQIEGKYINTGKVKFVYKDFPLSNHPEAQPAAEAARCVRKIRGDVGYFLMHDKLFENQGSLSRANYVKWAMQIGVNEKLFNDCLESGEFSSVVRADLAYGQQLGVTGTPGFFVGNSEKGFVLVSGAQPFSVFEQVLESYLN